MSHSCPNLVSTSFLYNPYIPFFNLQTFFFTSIYIEREKDTVDILRRLALLAITYIYRANIQATKETKSLLHSQQYDRKISSKVFFINAMWQMIP